jgi:flagellar FliL protein
LKISVSLEIASEKDAPQLEQVMPRIVDNFQVYLRELRIEDLRGSAGLQRLREELLLRVATAAQPVVVKDVLFREMLIQ